MTLVPPIGRERLRQSRSLDPTLRLSLEPSPALLAEDPPEFPIERGTRGAQTDPKDLARKSLRATPCSPSPQAKPQRPLQNGLPSGLRSERLAALLSDLPSQLHRGHQIREPQSRLATGLPDIDELLGGGLPGGSLSEISGQPSSGRTSLMLSLLASETRRGECVGLIDYADAFHPPSAQEAGVDLAQVLWARVDEPQVALRCAERLLETEGFPLVVIDARDHRQRRGRFDRGPAWLRLSRLASATRTALVLVSDERLAGAHAEAALEMQAARARFSGSLPLLDELEIHALLVRHRAAPTGRGVAVRLRTSSAA